MKLTKEHEDMLAGKEGRGVQKAMEIIVGMGEAQGAEDLVKIFLRPPHASGCHVHALWANRGEWAHDLTWELTQDIKQLKVPATIEPKFCDLSVAKSLRYPDEVIEEIRAIQGKATQFYEDLGVVPTYTGHAVLPFTAGGGWASMSASRNPSPPSVATPCWGPGASGMTASSPWPRPSPATCPGEGVHLDEKPAGRDHHPSGEGPGFQPVLRRGLGSLQPGRQPQVPGKKPRCSPASPSNIDQTELKHLHAVIAVESGAGPHAHHRRHPGGSGPGDGP